MKILLLLIALILFIAFVFIVEVLYAKYGFGDIPTFTNPSRTSREFGTTGEPLTYLVMGDSTSAGQGADYQQGIAVQTAEYLAQKQKITFLNTSTSGAVVNDLLQDQLPAVSEITPDIVLLSVGANDVTRVTNLQIFESDLSKIIQTLIQKNCSVKIVLTGSPDMSAAKRFLPPLSWLAGWRTGQVNEIIERQVRINNLTFAPIAKKTGDLFKKDRSLFSEDSYHPNEKGYATWIEVIKPALDDSLNQPVHCK